MKNTIQWYSLDKSTGETKPIDAEVGSPEWVQSVESRQDRRIDIQYFGCWQWPTAWIVSTVFLGLDHSFRDGDEPVLFETMCLGGPLDQEQDRCCTLAQARVMHRAMVARANVQWMLTPRWKRWWISWKETYKDILWVRRVRLRLHMWRMRKHTRRIQDWLELRHGRRMRRMGRIEKVIWRIRKQYRIRFTRREPGD